MTTSNIPANLFLNLTPHTVHLYIGEDQIVDIESKGLARVSVKKEMIDSINGIPLNQTKFGDTIEGISYEQIKDYEYIIVSRIVKDRINNLLWDNMDKYIVPDEIVRDSSGNILGCRGFSL